MRPDARPRIHLGAATDWLPRWLAVLFPITIAGSVLGQSVLPPAPGFQNAPSVPQLGAPNSAQQTQNQVNNQISGQTEAGATAPTGEQPGGQEGATPEGATGATPAVAPLHSIMQWGALHLRASASYQLLYTTELHTAPGQTADTLTHTITPVLTADIGPHVSLSYAPSFRFFSQRDFHNTVDQFVSLTAGVSVGDWGLGMSQTYSHTDEPLIETGSQTSQEEYDTGLNASYRVNDKISLDTIASMSFQMVNEKQIPGITNSALTSSTDYSGTEWANYHFSEGLNAGLGFTLGYLEQNGGFRSLSQDYQGRVNWNPGPKLSFSVSGGADVQHFLDTDLPDLVNPIYNANISYLVFDQTTLMVYANRSVTASLFQNEIDEATSVGIGVQQRLLGFLQLSAGFGYNTTTFKSTAPNPIPGQPALGTVRTDDGTTYNVGLGAPFLKRGNIAAFYQYTHNNSSQGEFGFDSSQIGVTVSWLF